MRHDRKNWGIVIRGVLSLVVAAGMLFGYPIYLKWRHDRKRLAYIQTALQGKTADFLPPTPFPATALVPETESWVEGELGAMVAEDLITSRPQQQAFSADSRYLAITGVGAEGDPRQGLLEVHDLQTRELVRRFRLGNRDVGPLRFSPSGKRLLVSLRSHLRNGTRQNLQIVLDVASGDCVYASTSQDSLWLVDDDTLLGELGEFYTIDVASGKLARYFGRPASFAPKTWGQAPTQFSILGVLPQPDGESILAYGFRIMGHANYLLHIERWNWRTGTLIEEWEPLPARVDSRMRVLVAADRTGDLLLIATGSDGMPRRLQHWRLSLATGDVTPLPDIGTEQGTLEFPESYPFAEHPAAIGQVSLGHSSGSRHQYRKVGTDGEPSSYLATFEWNHEHLISPDGSLLLVADSYGARVVPTQAPGDVWYLNGPRPGWIREYVNFSRRGQHEIIGSELNITVRPTLGQAPAAITEPAPEHFVSIDHYLEGTRESGFTQRVSVRIHDMQPVGYDDRELPGLPNWVAQQAVIRDDGTRLAIGLEDGRVVGCDPEGLHAFEVALPASGSGLEVLPGDGGFLVATYDGSLTRCSWQGEAVWSAKLSEAYGGTYPGHFSSDIVRAVSADGTVAAVAVDGQLLRIDLASGAVLSRTPPDRSPAAACLSADGSRLTCHERRPSSRLAIYDSAQSTEEPIATAPCAESRVLLADRGDRILVSTWDRRVLYLSADDLHLVVCANLADAVAGVVGLRTASTGDAEDASAVVHELGFKTFPWRAAVPDGPHARLVLEGLRSGQYYAPKVLDWRASPDKDLEAWWERPAPTDILCTFADRGRQARLTRADDPQANGVLMLFNDYEWLFFTPDGRFDGSEGVARHLVRPTTTDGLPTVAPFTMDSPQRVPGLLHTTLRLPLPEATPTAE